MMKHFVPIAAFAVLMSGCGASEEHQAAHGGSDDHHAESVSHEAAELSSLPDDGVVPAVEVLAAWLRPHPLGRDVTAAYFTASLSEGRIDRLVAARIDGAERVELHGHTMDDQGMMRMRPIGPQELVDDGPLVFTPGGKHLMVHGLDPVVEGDVVTGALIFERAGEVAVTFSVRNMPPAASTEN